MGFSALGGGEHEHTLYLHTPVSFTRINITRKIFEDQPAIPMTMFPQATPEPAAGTHPNCTNRLPSSGGAHHPNRGTRPDAGSYLRHFGLKNQCLWTHARDVDVDLQVQEEDASFYKTTNVLASTRQSGR